MKIVEKNQFKNEINEGIVVVDFFATWCAPCKAVAPILEELSSDMEEKVKFIKVDIDNSPEIAKEYSITNIPSMLIFKEGKKEEMLVGFLPKESIKSKIEACL